MILKDAGLMISLTGALLGSAIIYMFPSIIFLHMTHRRLSEGTLKRTKTLRVEQSLNVVLIVMGFFLGIFGVIAGLMNYS